MVFFAGRSNPGPNRIGAGNWALSYPNLNTLRTRCTKSRTRTGPHRRLIQSFNPAKSSAPRSATSRPLPNCDTSRSVASLQFFQVRGGDFPGVELGLLVVQVGVGEVLDRDTR
jgi:hypothetical protein